MRTYRVTHTPLLHHGRRYAPGEPIELADEHAHSLVKAGLIERMDAQASPLAGEGQGQALTPSPAESTAPKVQPAPRKGAKA